VGTFSFYIAACVLGVVLWGFAFLASQSSSHAMRLRNKLSAMLFWNRLNQSIFESILIVSFCGMITFRYNLAMDTWGEKV